MFGYPYFGQTYFGGFPSGMSLTITFVGSGTISGTARVGASTSASFAGVGIVTGTASVGVNPSAGFTGSGVVSGVNTIGAAISALFAGFGYISTTYSVTNRDPRNQGHGRIIIKIPVAVVTKNTPTAVQAQIKGQAGIKPNKPVAGSKTLKPTVITRG